MGLSTISDVKCLDDDSKGIGYWWVLKIEKGQELPCLCSADAGVLGVSDLKVDVNL